MYKAYFAIIHVTEENKPENTSRKDNSKHMDKLVKMINARLELLRRAVKLAEKDEKTFPEGRLRVSRSPRQTRYYKMTDSSDKVG